MLPKSISTFDCAHDVDSEDKCCAGGELVLGVAMVDEDGEVDEDDCGVDGGIC